MLGNVHTLNLSFTNVVLRTAYCVGTRCKYVSKVRILDLSFTNVVYVSMLGNVHTLHICCTKVVLRTA